MLPAPTTTVGLLCLLMAPPPPRPAAPWPPRVCGSLPAVTRALPVDYYYYVSSFPGVKVWWKK